MSAIDAAGSSEVLELKVVDGNGKIKQWVVNTPKGSVDLVELWLAAGGNQNLFKQLLESYW